MILIGSVLLHWRVVLGWTSLDLERLCSLHLLLKNAVLSLLCILDLLLDVDLQILFRKSHFFFCGLSCDLNFLRVRLGLLDGIVWKLLLFLLGLLECRCNFMLGKLGFFSVHSQLRGLVKFLWLLLRLLNDGANELGPLLNSHFHPHIKCISNLDALLFNMVWSSFPCSGQSLIRDLTNFFWLFQLSQLSSLVQLLLDGLKSDGCGTLLVEQPLTDQVLVGRVSLFKWHFNDDCLVVNSLHL